MSAIDTSREQSYEALMSLTPDYLNQETAQRQLVLGNAISQLQIVRHALLESPDKTIELSGYDTNDFIPKGTIAVGKGLVINIESYDADKSVASFGVGNRRGSSWRDHHVWVSGRWVQSVTATRFDSGGMTNVRWPKDLLDDGESSEVREMARKAQVAYLFTTKHLLSK